MQSTKIVRSPANLPRFILLTIERRVTIHFYHPVPYASPEFLDESPSSKWAFTRLYAGCLLPLTEHLQLDPYYEHVNNTRKHPNQQFNREGVPPEPAASMLPQLLHPAIVN